VTDEPKKEAVEEFEIVEQPVAGEAEVAEPKEEDERLRNEDDEDEDDNSSGSDGETPEQRSERRKEERRKRRERQRAAEAANKAELQRLREQNDFMVSRMQQMEAFHLRNEAREIDGRIAYARDTYSRAEQALKQAVARGDGDTVAQAMRVRDQASSDYHNAVAMQSRLHAIGNDPGPQMQYGPDPRVVEKARAFVEKHSWIDPSGMADEDSAVARALDMKLQADGYDPSTEEYWGLLEKTLEKRLPHRFQRGRGGPPVAGGFDRAASGKRTFYLSPERKKALMDSGDWDDPVRRNKMIKVFADYDAKQKSTATR